MEVNFKFVMKMTAGSVTICSELQVPGASEASIRNLPPSAIGDPSQLDAMSLLAANKGKPMEAIVEQVRDGSTVRVYLLPEFQFVQVFVAGIQVCIIMDKSVQNLVYIFVFLILLY